MKPDHAIEVKNVTKKFKVYYDKGHTLKEKTLFKKRRSYEERTVLDGISFEIKKGEAVGLIGHNGCGKSTTLKLLTKIMYPDSGTIEMNGRVSSLLELGAGFHPDLSGRENIYINASIFGLTKKEIDQRAGEIIAFSELEEFIDHPVRTYSSGMYMRLAFAVAIHVDADILLVDEILAVGDANFQAKCFQKLRELKSLGITIVIVSHSLTQIEQICERSIWLDSGKIKEAGKPREVHPVYLDYMGLKRRTRSEKSPQQSEEHTEIRKKNTETGQKVYGNLDVRIVKSELLDENQNRCHMFRVGDKMIIRVQYECRNEELTESEFGFHIFRSDGMDCYGTNTLLDQVETIKLKKTGTVQVEFDALPLLQGTYKIDLAFQDDTGLTFQYLYQALSFEIINPYEELGAVRLAHRWVFDGKKAKRR
ncbi:MAG: ABC transporter ATP-binding protein [Eubacterium sp.]|nr:ABC transporter ATP-binding protein [Eubacterium sp.]